MKPFTFMRSLRNKLLSTLLIIHLLMIGGVSWYFFSCYGDMIGTMKDDQLSKIADAWATNKQIPALMPLMVPADKLKSAFVVQLWDADGQLRASSWPELHAPLQAKKAITMPMSAVAMIANGVFIRDPANPAVISKPFR